MSTDDNFNEFYNNTISSELLSLDKLRLAKKKKNFFLFLINLAIVIAIWALAVVIARGFSFDSDAVEVEIVIVLILTVLCFSFLLYFTKKNKNAYVAEYKDKIIARLVKFIEPSLEYHKDKQISRAQFVNSNIFHQTIDRLHGDDYVSGKIGQTEFEFSEIKAIHEEEYTDDDGNTRTKDVTVFKGLFFIADFHKNFKGDYYVLPDKAERRFGSTIGKFFQSLNKSRGQLIKMENLEFEKAFVVYGADQIEARYILSSNMMEKILSVKKMFNKDIYISFTNQCINIAIPFKEDLFEPKYHRSIVNDKKTIEFFKL
ncbi:MAG: DUF3137 domain-containing protein [Ignavibacteria bacterium]|nr:DUF3137 domain-containing protein [Ignavibacteria bacterium]